MSHILFAFMSEVEHVCPYNVRVMSNLETIYILQAITLLQAVKDPVFI